MSELSKLLRKISRHEPAPLGFGRGPTKRAPTMLLAAIASERWAQGVADAVAGGADFVLLAGRPNAKDLAEAVAGADGMPCGLLAGQSEAADVSKLRDAGLDFVAVEPQAPAKTLANEELGLVLHLKDDLTDIQLRTIEPLPFDAIYFERDASPLSIMHQMELQRVSGLARKPLLMVAHPDVEQDDLLCLRDAGAVLVALDLKERGAVEALSRLRGLIDALPPRRKPRREDRTQVTLPGAAHESESDDEDDFEDE
ncbi:MAG: hypothetical protein WEE64_09900 [Dehalococcoidia bacterium]